MRTHTPWLYLRRMVRDPTFYAPPIGRNIRGAIGLEGGTHASGLVFLTFRSAGVRCDRPRRASGRRSRIRSRAPPIERADGSFGLPTVIVPRLRFGDYARPGSPRWLAIAFAQ